MGLALSTVINSAKIDNTSRFSRLFTHNMHPATPCGWGVAGDALEDTQVNVLL